MKFLDNFFSRELKVNNENYIEIVKHDIQIRLVIEWHVPFIEIIEFSNGTNIEFNPLEFKKQEDFSFFEYDTSNIQINNELLKNNDAVKHLEYLSENYNNVLLKFTHLQWTF